MTSVGENIKKTRNKIGITQEELAEKINVTRQAVSNWENGKTEPDIETLTKIAQIFDISIDELVDGIPRGLAELRGKKIYLNLGIIFSTLYLIASLFLFVIYDPVKEYVAATYDTFVYFLIGYVIKPFTVICGGIGVSSIITYSTGFYVKNSKLRLAFIIIGVCCFLLTTAYLAYIPLVYRLNLPFILSPFYYMHLLDYPFLHVLAPVFIFFGLAKK